MCFLSRTGQYLRNVPHSGYATQDQCLLEEERKQEKQEEFVRILGTLGLFAR